jgi:hypothetical protein
MPRNEGGVMVTLDDLKEAVAEYDDNGSLHEVVQETIILFAREYIAREQLLDTELTAEICERLGMVRVTGSESRYRLDQTNYVVSLDYQFIGRGIDGVNAFAWGSKPKSLTIRHLLAAACLAGVTVDLGRLAK